MSKTLSMVMKLCAMSHTNNSEFLQSEITFSDDILVFGLSGDRYLNISEVPSGAACNCVCPICGKKLIAKKGKIRIHHFAHADDAENSRIGHAGALQTQLHIMAKGIIAESGEFVIPEVYVPGTGRSLTLPARSIHVDNVYLEQQVDNFIPDIIVESNGKKLLIEIYVTHKVDETKLAKIQSSGFSCIEIDLSSYRNGISIHDLQQELISGTDHKQWLYNAYVSSKVQDLLFHCQKIPLSFSSLGPKTESCPIFSRIDNRTNNSYAYFHIDCLACPNLVNLGEKSDPNIFRDYIYCAAT